MSVQRFNHVCEIYAGKPMSLHPEGDWVGYTVLAEREQRIKVLEDAIRDALNDSETGDGWGPDVTVANKLRAALATEGEKQ